MNAGGNVHLDKNKNYSIKDFVEVNFQYTEKEKKNPSKEPLIEDTFVL